MKAQSWIAATVCCLLCTAYASGCEPLEAAEDEATDTEVETADLGRAEQALTTISNTVTCTFTHPAGVPDTTTYSCGYSLANKQEEYCTGHSSCSLTVHAAQGATYYVYSWNSKSVAVKKTLSTDGAKVNQSFSVFKRAAKRLKGPWLANVTKTSATVKWETDVSAENDVHYQPLVNGSPSTAVGVQGTLTTVTSPSGATTYLHSAELTGLTSESGYNYVVGDASTEDWKMIFTDASDATKPFRFAAYGDVQGGTTWHKAVNRSILIANLAEASNPKGLIRAVLQTGDRVDASTSDASWSSAWDTVFTEANQTMFMTPYYPAPGNNDLSSAARQTYYQKFAETNYSRDAGNTHFVFLCGGCDLTAQKTWLTSDLTALASVASNKHVVIVVHQPPYSFGYQGSGNNSNTAVRSLIDTLMSTNQTLFTKLAAVVSGHNHYYQRVIRKYSFSGKSDRFVPFLTIGGAGASGYAPSSYADGENPALVKVKATSEPGVPLSAPFYALFDVAGASINVTIVKPSLDPSGADSTLESFALPLTAL